MDYASTDGSLKGQNAKLKGINSENFLMKDGFFTKNTKSQTKPPKKLLDKPKGRKSTANLRKRVKETERVASNDSKLSKKAPAKEKKPAAKSGKQTSVNRSQSRRRNIKVR